MNASNPIALPPVRLAVVQYGDYAKDLELMEAGGKETYAGMFQSLVAVKSLLADHPHLMINLNPPHTREMVGDGIMMRIPAPQPRFLRRGFLNYRHWAGQICEALDSFQPTHLLMRTSGYLALRILQLSTRRGWKTLALFANNFASKQWFESRVEWQLTKYLNHPSVRWVGNHRKISAQSLIDHGVLPEKVIAYDWPAARNPGQYATKQLDRTKPIELLFAANMIEAKGIGDLILALGTLRRKGLNVRLTALGIGADRERMRHLAASIAPDAVDFPGQVDNDLLFDAMRRCTLMCVVTRPEFIEGGSLVLTEALASRTPAVLSDQIMFRQSFLDGEGVRFFRAGDPSSLATMIETVISDEHVYRELSSTTSEAFDRVQCKTSFADLIAKWQATLTEP